MNENTMWLVLAVAVLIEQIVETLKPLWDKDKGWNKDGLIALAVSLLVCGLGGLDLFALIGYPLLVPIAGSLLTGIIASRGTNVVHELIKLLTGLRANTQAPNPGLNAGNLPH